MRRIDRFCSLLCVALLLAIASGNVVGAPIEKTAPAAAQVEHPVKEADLATINLTPEAEKRLGITTAALERRAVRRTRMLAGEIIIPPAPGRSLSEANDATGSRSVFSILPSLNSTDLIRIAEAQIDAEGQVERARIELEATKNSLDRAEKLLRDKAGSQRGVDDARTAVAVAQAAWRTAKTRRELLGATVLPTNNPLQVWVRVPIYVGDLARLRINEAAQVGDLTAAAGGATRVAAPVTGPPSANPAAATVDVFYELDNADRALRLGEKVAVRIGMKEPEQTLVVPASTIVQDIYGGAWVYEAIAPQTFVRRRVQVVAVVEQEALLASGPPPQTQVVTNGAAELFGIELGFAH